MEYAIFSVFLVTTLIILGWRIVRKMEKQWRTRKNILMKLLREQGSLSSEDAERALGVGAAIAQEMLEQMVREELIVESQKTDYTTYYKKR